jgi:hypothetical protein
MPDPQDPQFTVPSQLSEMGPHWVPQSLVVNGVQGTHVLPVHFSFGPHLQSTIPMHVSWTVPHTPAWHAAGVDGQHTLAAPLLKQVSPDAHVPHEGDSPHALETWPHWLAPHVGGLHSPQTFAVPPPPQVSGSVQVQLSFPPQPSEIAPHWPGAQAPGVQFWHLPAIQLLPLAHVPQE